MDAFYRIRMKVPLIKIIDRIIGSAIMVVLYPFTKMGNIGKKKCGKILMIQLWGIGETILTLPVIVEVKEKYRSSEVVVLCTERNRLNPLSILFFIIKNFRKYDLVVDMEEYLNISAIIAFFVGKLRIGYSHNLRFKMYNLTVSYDDNQHVVNTFLDLLDPLGINVKNINIPKLNYTKNVEIKIDGIIKVKKERKIGIVPGAAESGKSRMWPRQRYIQLCKKLIEKKYNLVFIGSKSEVGYNQAIIGKLNADDIIDTTGKISIEELFCLIDKLDLIITNDTGPLHIASAQKTKVVGLFGPNTPTRFGPYRVKNTTFYKSEKCEFSPCINVHRGEVPDCLYSKSGKDYQKCMKAISVKEVLDAALKMV
jgi:heptosyltransferase-2